LRLHFGAKPWDLYIALGYTTMVTVFLLALGVGTLFALLLVLFVPGYVLVAALFPGSQGGGKPGIDWVERIALSFALSIAVVPLLGFLLSFAPWGIRFAPIIVTVAIFTIFVGFAAHLRRKRLQPEHRLSLTIDLGIPGWRKYAVVDKGLTIALAASVVVAGGTLAYVLVTPRPGERFTEFYILGPGGNASGYPTRLNVSEQGTVFLGVVNHEFSTINYTVRVDLVGVRFVYNTTAGFNETVEVNRTTWSTINVTLADGQDWTQPYTFRIDDTGIWKVQFLLFRDGSRASSYRELHLYVQIF